MKMLYSRYFSLLSPNNAQQLFTFFYQLLLSFFSMLIKISLYYYKIVILFITALQIIIRTSLCILWKLPVPPMGCAWNAKSVSKNMTEFGYCF